MNKELLDWNSAEPVIFNNKKNVNTEEETQTSVQLKHCVY